VAKVAVKVQQLFLALAVRLADFYDEIGVSNPHPSSPLPTLLLARMCHHLQSWGIPHVHTLLLDLAAMSPLPAELSISLPDIIEKLCQAAGKLQVFYVKRQGQRLSEMIHLGIDATPWLRLKEPRDVRQAIEVVVDEIIAMRTEIGRVFPPRDKEREVERRDTTKDAPGRGRHKDASAKLFEKKGGHIWGRCGGCRLDPHGNCAGVLKSFGGVPSAADLLSQCLSPDPGGYALHFCLPAPFC